MLTKNMTQLFEKLNDLKAVFAYGQKIIPIIQNLVDFMTDTIPLLESINHSIADSTSKIPKASHQISNVTHANEMATTEILDLVDVISNEVSKIEETLKKEIIFNDSGKELLSKLTSSTTGNAEAQKLITELQNLFTVNIIPTAVFESIEKIKNDAYNITLSLQVQDITSQQLAAVNHLIESVQNKLSGLIVEIEEAEVHDHKIDYIKEPDSMEIEAPNSAAFNPNARYKNDGESQKIADELIGIKSTASQEEIDKLFS